MGAIRGLLKFAIQESRMKLTPEKVEEAMASTNVRPLVLRPICYGVNMFPLFEITAQGTYRLNKTGRTGKRGEKDTVLTNLEKACGLYNKWHDEVYR